MASGQVQTVMSGEINALHTVGSSASEGIIFVAPTKVTVVGIDLVENAATGADSTNYGTATIYNKGPTGSGTTSVATRATNLAGGGATVKDDPTAMTLSSNIALAKGDALTVGWVEAGTSLDLTRPALAIHYVVRP